MLDVFLIIGWLEFFVIALFAALFLLTTFFERPRRAFWRGVFVFLPMLGVFTAVLLPDYPLKKWILLFLFVVTALVILIALFRNSKPESIRIPGPQRRIDERDAIFHRFYRLQPGTADFKTYYQQHPEKKEFDDAVRAMPSLAAPGSKSYHPLVSPFVDATFDVVEKLTGSLDWGPLPKNSVPMQASAGEFTRRVKGFARYLGADLVGATRLNPAYVYSHIGRSPGTWGAPITLNHPFALAFAVKMRHDMIRRAPETPELIETAHKYIDAAKIGVAVAGYIRQLGYEARAHADGNYRVLCIPIAADAGLGEPGRLGLLITPQFGPRIRLSVVTTTMPLVPDKPIHFGVQHFCTICKKCAENCPSGSIDGGEKKVYSGVEKWQSDQESCYRFWRKQGTDCAVCINVCPYSYPNTLLHKIMRWFVRRNNLSRRLAFRGDLFFYGRRPKNTHALPDWLRAD